MQALIFGHAQGLKALWQGAVSSSGRERKRVGLGTYLRLCAPVSNGRRSEQLKEDSKSALLRRFLRGEVIHLTLFGIRTYFAGASKLVGDQ